MPVKSVNLNKYFGLYSLTAPVLCTYFTITVAGYNTAKHPVELVWFHNGGKGIVS